MINKIIENIYKKKNEIIEDSINLINIPSIIKNKNENIKCLEYIVNKAKKEGIKTYYTENMDCAVLEIGEGDETLGILTHVDVVDIGDIEKWSTPPFKGVFDGKYIIGRGAMDDKGPTIIIFTIMRVLNSLNLNFKRKIQLIIGTSEEGEWTDMESFKKEFKNPDFGFTPDGAFPIHNIEKGYADIKIQFDVSLENEYGSIIFFKSGDSPNTIPSWGKMMIEFSSEENLKLFNKNNQAEGISTIKDHLSLNVSSIGKSSHSSLPQNGDNALIKLCRWLCKINFLDNGAKKALEFILKMDGNYTGSRLGFNNKEKYLNGEYIGETFACPTILKLENNKLILNINIRHKYGVDLMEIENIFNNLSEKYSFSYTINNYLSPLFVSKDNKLFSLMNKAYEESTGLSGGFSLAGGTSYTKAFPNTVSWGPVFPGEKDSCHQENEMINIDSIMKCAEIYVRFMYDFAVGSLPINKKPGV